MRFKNVLVLTPWEKAIFSYPASLREAGAVETRARIAALVEREKIDVFFVSLYGDNYLLPLEFLAELRKKTRIVLWCWDDELSFDVHSRYYARAADAVVTTDYFSVAAYGRLGVPAIVWYGSLAQEMYPASKAVRDIDVSFVGNCRKTDRRDYMDFLEANGIKVERFGLGSARDFLPDSEMPAIFARSKINLNFSRLEAGEGGSVPPPRVMGHKLRTIEVAMTRSFCLSEYYPALPRVFDVGGEIACFSDPQSLLDQVRYYLAHDEEREQVAARAHARALRDYEDGPCLDRVTAELGAIFSKIPAGSAPLALEKSPEFKRRQIGDLFLHGVSLLRRGRTRAWADLAPELFQYGPGTFLAGAATGAARGFVFLRRKLRDFFS